MSVCVCVFASSMAGCVQYIPFFITITERPDDDDILKGLDHTIPSSPPPELS